MAASTAYHVIDWLEEVGLRVPDGISLAVASVPYRDEHISGINENVPFIGAQAVEAVGGMIHRNEAGLIAPPVQLAD